MPAANVAAYDDVIVVDTNVWSHAFRRREDDLANRVRARLRVMRLQHELVIPGIALQEFLSGLQNQGQASHLARSIAPFRVLLAEHDDHHQAAHFANLCRWRGITSSTADCLIAAQAIRAGASVFSLDEDFALMELHVPGLRLERL